MTSGAASGIAYDKALRGFCPEAVWPPSGTMVWGRASVEGWDLRLGARIGQNVGHGRLHGVQGWRGVCVGSDDLGRFRFAIEVPDRRLLVARFGEGAAACLGGAVQADGVPAQAEDQADRYVFRHRQADGAERSQAEGDHLADRQGIHRVAGGAGFDGVERAGASVIGVAFGGDEKYWGQEGDDHVCQVVG